MFGEAKNLDIDEDTLLEDEDIFKSPIENNVIPVLRDDVKLIATIESEMQGIQYLLQDITKSRGVNKEIALEALEYTDDITEKDINYYTNHPSSTKLKVTIESLIKSIGDKLKKIYETIREWIRKLVNWFTGLFKKNPTDKDYESSKANLSINEEKSNQAWDAIVDQLQAAININNTVNSVPEYINKVIPERSIPTISEVVLKVLEHKPNVSLNTILKQEDPLIHDMMNIGPYTKLTTEISTKLVMALQNIKVKLGAIKEVFQQELEGEHSVSQREYNRERLKIINNPISININNKPHTLSDAIQLIMKVRSNVMSAKASEPIPYEDLMVRLLTNTRTLNVKAIMNVTYKSMDTLVGIESKLSELQSQDIKLEYGDYWSKGNDQMVSELRLAMNKVSMEINLLTVLIRYVKMAADYYFFMVRDITHYQYNVMDWLITEGKKTGIKVPSELVAEIGHMNKLRNRNYSRYKNYVGGNK